MDESEVFRLADGLIEKPLAWSRSVPTSSDTPALSFVKFRVFYRAVKMYCSTVQLLRSEQWEDALVLTRSLYELNVNLSEIVCSSDPERTARKFVKFGQFEQLRLERRRLGDQLRDERLKAQPSAQIVDELRQRLEVVTSFVDRDFGEFRMQERQQRKGRKWQDSWSGLSVETRALHLAEKTGGKAGQSDYFIFALGSLFTHSAPGALFLGLGGSSEAPDWNKFRAVLESGVGISRAIVKEASGCLIDITGMAGDCIAGYERQWFDEFALPLLKKF